MSPLHWQQIGKTFVAALLCCVATANTIFADELRLRSGIVVQADQIWERDGQVWFRQGQTVRSVPKSEVVVFGNTIASESSQQPTKAVPFRKATQQMLPQAIAAPAFKQNSQPLANAKPVTRIVLKDGGQIDAEASWEVGDKIGYRLGTMYTFVEKAAIQRVVPNYVPQATEEIAKPVPISLPYSTGNYGLDSLIASNATRHKIDPLLVYFVMRQESSFNYRAVSRAGARGLMQLMPATARQLGVRNIDDPAENIEAGTRHLKYLFDRYNGDVNLVLAAYNAGEEAVARYGNRVPPYRETQNYVSRIGWAYYRARQ